jgi:hypothetical protein
MALVVTNGPRVAAHFDAEAAAIGPRAAAEVDLYARRLAEYWRARIAKRTGATAGTIHAAGGRATSTAPNIHRLEAGFHGADSLGRVYDQEGQPALGPAFDLIVPEFETAIDTIVAESLGGF